VRCVCERLLCLIIHLAKKFGAVIREPKNRKALHCLLLRGGVHEPAGGARMPDPSPRTEAARTQWVAVGSIAAGTFVLVTTEFLPIGLLSQIAADMHVPEGTAGLSVTGPGFIAALAAPILAVAAGRIDRRLIILLLTAAIVAANLIGALAPTFGMLMIGRLILGLAVGGLWTFAVAVGRRLVPESAGARATSVISAGISAGTIFGMPVGALCGDLIGWRAVFAANAVLSLLVLLVQMRFLPRLAASAAIRIGQLRAFAKIRMAAIGLLAAGLIAGAHFIGYTFLEPFLRGTLGLGQTGVALVLAGYAAAGIVGAFAGERLAVLDVRRALVMAALLMAVSVPATAVAASLPAAAVLLVMVWGMAFGAVPVCVQIWMYQSSPKLYEAGSALMVSAFQISLAAGSALGGFLVNARGLSAAFAVSGVVSFLGAAAVTILGRALLPRPGKRAGDVSR